MKPIHQFSNPSYQSAIACMKTAQSVYNGKPLGCNTRLHVRSAPDKFTSYAVRLHNTDVVTYLCNGDVVLNSGGYQTTTTKRRMNDYSPAQVWQKDWQWFVQYGGQICKFVDGMILRADGSIEGGGSELTAISSTKKVS